MPFPISELYAAAVKNDPEAAAAWLRDAAPSTLAAVELAADDSPAGLALVRAITAARARRGVK